jgi:hypothetical protein
MVKTVKRIPKATEKKGAVPGKGRVPKFPPAASAPGKGNPKSPPKNGKNR